MFIKVKKDGRVKGRKCEYVQKKHKNVVLGDKTLPTVSTESVLITATIDTNDGQDVVICDILGDFLSSDMREDVKMALRVRLEEPMVIIAPHIYRHHVLYKKGRPILYITLKKALNGCLSFELLFCEWLMTDMRDKGFEINHNNPCVANKMVGGKQMRICWHVEDLKVSNVDPKEVTKFMELLEGIDRERNIKRGKVHD